MARPEDLQVQVVILHRLQEMANWFLRLFRLEDWTIRVYCEQLPDDAAAGESDAGMEMTTSWSKDAKVWVSPSRCEKFGFDLEHVLFHECAHVLFEDAGIDDSESDANHRVVEQIGSVALSLWKCIRKLDEFGVAYKDL